MRSLITYAHARAIIIFSYINKRSGLIYMIVNYMILVQKKKCLHYEKDINKITRSVYNIRVLLDLE